MFPDRIAPPVSAPLSVDQPRNHQAGEHILSVDGVSKRFGGVFALDDVSFSLSPGDIHALVGENGAGKSTLIKIVTGVYRPDSGTVSFEGFARPLLQAGRCRGAGISTIYQEVKPDPAAERGPQHLPGS